MDPFGDGADDESSRLDYVITQMDIVRMQRNASRHLDVESIYQLPTVTYQPTTTNQSSKKMKDNQMLAEVREEAEIEEEVYETRLKFLACLR